MGACRQAISAWLCRLVLGLSTLLVSGCMWPHTAELSEPPAGPVDPALESRLAVAAEDGLMVVFYRGWTRENAPEDIAACIEDEIRSARPSQERSRATISRPGKRPPKCRARTGRRPSGKWSEPFSMSGSSAALVRAICGRPPTSRPGSFTERPVCAGRARHHRSGPYRHRRWAKPLSCSGCVGMGPGWGSMGKRTDSPLESGPVPFDPRPLDGGG